ncbi:extracellular solute-binding protein [Azohydromonas caseinilytica]|uniref:Extracellular solute-binding protein n=1 Tax=Azohydromonas caseinilytica TaxID=2728836 RepID=A0A848F3W1_9BURK|nr:extracellular solute-binding protein [Azohydromonas caseinilytica]NML14334.1 extracellular solute-binding protein [Azohydromonas caseinilytica]
MLKKFRPILAALSAVTVLAFPAQAQEKVLNLYSARHYQTDEALYNNFTKATGIRINRVDADDAGILARLKSEGSSSPADVILLVDAARLWRAEVDGLFLPVKSEVLEKRIPANLRGKDEGQGSQWFGFSTRARVVVYNKLNVKRDDVDTYEELADPKNKGKFCMRSASHPYNLSLFGSVVEHLGDQRAEQWLKGLNDNMARPPKGGDTDQIKAVASGECQIALTNSYYLARMMRSEKPEDRTVMERVGVVFPNQQSWGTHLNIAGGAVARHAKHTEEARRFLEYLSSDEAQGYFANGNNEWPVVPGLKLGNPALSAFGNFKSETIPVSVVGMNQVRVQQMLDRVGLR